MLVWFFHYRKLKREVALQLPLDPFFQTSRASKSEIQCIHLCANQDNLTVSVHFPKKQHAKVKDIFCRRVFLDLVSFAYQFCPSLHNLQKNNKDLQ